MLPNFPRIDQRRIVIKHCTKKDVSSLSVLDAMTSMTCMTFVFASDWVMTRNTKPKSLSSSRTFPSFTYTTSGHRQARMNSQMYTTVGGMSDRYTVGTCAHFLRTKGPSGFGSGSTAYTVSPCFHLSKQQFGPIPTPEVARTNQ